MDDKRDPGGSSSGQTEPASSSSLDAGGHEPASASEDPAINEARDMIQDAFDGLEATRRGHQDRDAGARRPDEATDGRTRGDATADATSGDPGERTAGGG